MVFQGGRSYSWLTEENLIYTNWQDGEPQQITGCSYMDTDGSWRTAGCDTKLQGGICQLQTGTGQGGWGDPGGVSAGVGDGIPLGTFLVDLGASVCCGTSTSCAPPHL